MERGRDGRLGGGVEGCRGRLRFGRGLESEAGVG